MRWLRRLLDRVRALPSITLRQVEREIDEELDFHVEMRTRDNVALGMSPDVAREEAALRFGNAEAVREECRAIAEARLRSERKAEMLDVLKQDIGYAMRSFLRQPVFAGVVVLTLGLGIGATTAIFSVLDGVVWTPLPVEEPNRVVFVWGVERGMRTGSSWASYPDLVDFEEMNSVFSGMAAWSNADLAITGPDTKPMRVAVDRVSHDLFRLLGIRPALGRGFLSSDDRRGAERVAIVSHGVWAQRFGGDSGVIGRTVTVGGVPHTIVGVMPPEDVFPEADLYVPMAHEHAEDQRSQHRLLAIARLVPGVTLDAAEADMKAVAARLEEAYPESNKRRSVRLERIRETAVGDVRPALIVLFGAVLFVLLIVCANVANLLLARASTRGREVAVRMALGAGRGRLVGQFLLESAVLALFGGALGVLVAFGGVELLLALSPGGIPRLSEVSIDGRVLAFALVLTGITGLLFGLAPALRASRPDLQSSLKEGGRWASAGGSSPRLRQMLVVVEMTLAVVLVVGAGLLINSFSRLQRVDVGFRPDNVLTVPLSLPMAKYDDWHRVPAIYGELVDRIEALPGVESAAVGYQHPLDGGWETSFIIHGVLEAPRGERPEARILPVSPGYFRTLGIPLKAGRTFSEQDGDQAPGVVIINESFARTFFPDQDPLGHRLERNRWWPDLPYEHEIIGVVGDVKMDGLTSSTPWAMYFPHYQVPFNDMYVMVHTAGAPLDLAAPVREQIWAMDEDLPVENVRSLEQILSREVAPERFRTTLLGLFAAIALVLAIIGIYGVLSYAVARRTGELGIRISLGARTHDILRLVLGQGMRLAVLGVLLGLAASLLLSRTISGLLFGVTPGDPMTLGAISLLLIVIAAAAASIPALRAARIDPVIALRAE